MTTVSLNQSMLRSAQPISAPFEGQLLEAVALDQGSTIRVQSTGAPAELPAAQSVKKTVRVVAPIIALALVAIAGWLIPNVLIKHGASYATAAAAVTGISVFAGIYAGAQAIERLLEPLSHWLLPTETSDDEYGKAVTAADKAVTAWLAEPTDATKQAIETAMNQMATKKNAIDELQDDRAVIFWAIASVVGILAAAQFNLFLLKLIGISTTYSWDVFATGLILGAGTKPLHELIGKLSSSSDSSGDSTTQATGATSVTS